MKITMTPGVRRIAIIAHVTSSVGLLGSIAAFLSLAIVGLTSQDEQMVRTAYPAMELITRFVIVPLAFASLFTGFVQSLGTSWGLFRHYWVLLKLAITVFAIVILLVKMQLIGYAAHLAKQTILSRADLHAAGLQLVVHSAGGLLVFLVPTILSIYKPRGLTPYGRRMQQDQRATPQQPYAQARHPAFHARFNAGGWFRGESITITLRRAYLLRFAVVIAVVHMVILHVASGGLRHH
jgi:hypothetical protein